MCFENILCFSVSLLKVFSLSFSAMLFFSNAELCVNGNGYEAWKNIKEANKDSKIYVGRSTTVYNSLFCVHTVCMSYIIKTFLLVSSSVSSKQLLCLCMVKAKKQNKNIQQRTLSSFITIPLYYYIYDVIPIKATIRQSI